MAAVLEVSGEPRLRAGPEGEPGTARLLQLPTEAIAPLRTAPDFRHRDDRYCFFPRNSTLLSCSHAVRFPHIAGAVSRDYPKTALIDPIPRDAAHHPRAAVGMRGCSRSTNDDAGGEDCFEAKSNEDSRRGALRTAQE